MIQLRKIDEKGMFLEDVIADSVPYLTEIVPVEETDTEGNTVVVDVERPLLDESGNPIPDPHYIETPVPDGLQLWHPKWNGAEWVEGMSQEQIDELQNQPQPQSTEERVEFLEQDYATLVYDSMAKDVRIDEGERMNAELLYMMMTGGM